MCNLFLLLILFLDVQFFILEVQKSLLQAFVVAEELLESSVFVFFFA